MRRGDNKGDSEGDGMSEREIVRECGGGCVIWRKLGY